MLKTFIYMFKDNNFWKKYLSLFGFVLIANSLINGSGTLSPALNNGNITVWYYILFFAGFIVMFIPYGYSISALKTTLGKSESQDLPMLDIKNNFIAGLKVVLSGAILVISLSLIIMLISLINALLSPYLGKFLPIIFSAVIFMILLILLFFGIAMCCRYVVKPSFLNFVNFKGAVQLINHNVWKYFKAFLVSVICTVFIYLIVFSSVGFLTKIGYWGLAIYCIFVSLLWTYHIYFLAGIFAQAVESDKL